MGIEGYHNYTICLRLKREIKKFQIWKRLIKKSSKRISILVYNSPSVAAHGQAHFARNCKGRGRCCGWKWQAPSTSSWRPAWWARTRATNPPSFRVDSSPTRYSGNVRKPRRDNWTEFSPSIRRFLPFSFPPPLMMPYLFALKLSFKDIRPR